MHKFLLLNFYFLISFQVSHAQFNAGSWIKTKVTYRDGAELDDANPIKYSYTRYNFMKKGIVRVSTSYEHKGAQFQYQFSNPQLKIMSDVGFVVNEFLVQRSSESELILLQKGNAGFDGDDCLLFYFISEPSFQNSFKPNADNILSVVGTDTVYLANEKLYPEYKGDKDYFDALKDGVPSQPSANLYFFATYIVGKDGRADSLKIIESFSPEFDKRILKNFNKTRENWQPAMLHGKPVAVQMKQEYRYLSSHSMLPAYNYDKKGSDAMKKGDFAVAIYFFDMGLGRVPSNAQMLYKRAVCKHELGNNEGACKDLQAIELLGDSSGRELLDKWCK